MRLTDLEGNGVRAWNRADIPHTMPDHDASLSQWLLHVPWSHPIWPWHILSIIHLRDLPGAEPAHKKYPDAEYELLIGAINPKKCPNPDPDSREGYPILSPLGVSEQFHGLKDAEIPAFGEALVKAIIAGAISPDEDYWSMWHRLICNTIEHRQNVAAGLPPHIKPSEA